MIRFLRWLPVLGWMALIFAISSQPVLPSPPNAPLLDVVFKKSGHIAAYTVLMALVLWALGIRDGAVDRPRTVLAFALVLAYAISDEFHQSFIPNRTALWTDVAIFDLTGAGIGWLTWHRRSFGAGRSRFAYLYAALFLYCFALAILFNLPYRGRAEQDSSTLLKDTWFLWGFSYFGFLLMPIAALLIEDGGRRGMRWLGYVIPYFALGILPLSLFLARRSDAETRNLQPPLQRMLERRWFWWLLPIGTLAISLIWLPQGSLTQLINTLNQNTGFWFMVLDIPLNHLAALPLLQADLQRRRAENKTMWLVATLLTGPIGLGVYMAVRRARDTMPSAANTTSPAKLKNATPVTQSGEMMD